MFFAALVIMNSSFIGSTYNVKSSRSPLCVAFRTCIHEISVIVVYLISKELCITPFLSPLADDESATSSDVRLGHNCYCWFLSGKLHSHEENADAVFMIVSRAECHE
jgi:hypothetical protein